MKARLSKGLFVFCVLFISIRNTAAQDTQNDYADRVGRPNFSVELPVELGFYNAATGGLHLDIPLATIAERGGKSVQVLLTYDSKLWSWNWQYRATNGWYPVNVHGSQGGWKLVLAGATDALISPMSCPPTPGNTSIAMCVNIGPNYGTSFSTCYSGDQNNPGQITYFNGWQYEIPDGDIKTFTTLQTAQANPQLSTCEMSDQPTGSAYADDGSGYLLVVNNYTNSSLYDPAGNLVGIEDTNGNLFSGSGGNLVDELGRIPVIETTNGNVQYYDILNSQGSRSRYTLTLNTVNVNTSFGKPFYTEYSGAITVVKSLTLPNGTTYSFGYDSGTSPGNYGELTSLTLPTGGVIQYGYSTFVDVLRNYSRWLTSRNSQGNTWLYNPTVGSGTQRVTVTKPNQESTAYDFSVSSTASGAWNTNITYFDASGNVVESQVKDYYTPPGSQPPPNLVDAGQDFELPIRLTTTLPLAGGSLSKKIEYSYDNCNNIGEVREWNWYGGTAPSTPARVTDAAYTCASSSYVAKNILNKPTSIVVKDGSGNLAAQTALEYDNYTAGISSSGAVQHDSSFSTSYTLRGNVTAGQHWRNTDGVWLTTRNQYDDAGNIISTTDPNSNTTSLSYADSWGDSHCAPSVGNAAAYRTKVTNALNQITTATYNSCTGKPASTTDANNQTNSFAYNDPLDRPTQTIYPADPSGNHPQTTLTYNDSPLPTSVTQATLITTGLTRVQETVLDALGRTSQVQTTSDPLGIDYADTTYDAVGRVASVSNAYRSTSDPTYGVTSYQYDPLNRITQVTKQDGSVVTSKYEQAAANSSNVDCTLTTDESGHARENCADGLGRMVEVDEPQASSGSMSSPYVTLYTYDVLDNLLSVNQQGDGSQAARIRTFTHDSLSHLLTAINPESGTVTYGYDANGNLLQKTSPAPNQTGTATQTISYCYDQLNRTIGKAYSAQSCPLSSPVAQYFYDAGTNGIGRLTSLIDQAGSGSYSYDALGRIEAEQRTIGGIQKSLSYAYNLDNSLATLTYPSGAVVAYTPDSAGRMLSAVDNGNGINYVTGATYAPNNSLLSYNNGSAPGFAGIANSFSYNPRLQPVNISAISPETSGTSATASVTIGGSLGTASSTSGIPPPVAASGSALTGYEDSSFVNHWMYEGGNQHLYEFSWNSSSGGSSYMDATQEAGGVLAAPNSALSNYLDANQNPHWVYEDGSQNLQLLAYGVNGRTWLNLDVTTLAASPAAASASPLTSKEDSNCQQEWAYFGANQHLVEAYAVGNGSSGCLGNDVWNFSDGTAAMNAPVAASGSALSTYFDTNQNPHWLYEDGSQNLQLFWQGRSSGSWGNLDVTATAGSPAAAPGSALATREDTDCMQHWAYFGANQHLYEVHAQGNAGGGCGGNEVWNFSDGTSATNAPAAASGSALSMYFDYSQTAHWIYEDSSGHIQLFWWSSGGWGHLDVTAAAGSPVAVPGSALGSYEDSNCMQHWLYLGSNQHLYEAHAQGSNGCSGGEVWGYTDITAATPAEILDSGTVSLNVGGFTATACFGSSTNPVCSGQAVNTTTAQVASALTHALNASNSPVTATVSGSTITLAGKNNVAFDAGIDALSTMHDNPSLFPNPSFTSAVTGFSGGSTASLPVFNITYNFNLGNGNNGNVIAITNNRDNTRSESFTYDALNRLTSAQNAGTNCSQKTAAGAGEYWGNSYGYDAWGNLLSKTVTKCSAENLSVTALANNHLSGYGYDAAGNMTHDATTGNNYTYDAENRITGAAGYTYTYDADGNRVEKSNGGAGTIYWYMSPGIVAESDLSGNLKSEYVFFGGERLARKDFPSGAVSYYFSDHLKTASVITDSAGNITEDEDYYPWGGEIPFVNNDSNHYKFTGKERDSETGLDYFGARYYGNPLSRFLTPDWAAKPTAVPYADYGNPQSLNLYSYVKNNPLSVADPDGHDGGNATDPELDKHGRFWKALHWFGLVQTQQEKDQQLHAQAERDRKLLSGMKNLTINGETPAEFAKNATDEEAIQGFTAARNFIFSQAARPCGPGVSCGIVFPLGLPEGSFSEYTIQTAKGALATDVQTNVTASEFGANLEASGFTRSTASDGTPLYTKGNVQYSIYPVSKSTQGPTAQLTVGGKIIAKIRLQ